MATVKLEEGKLFDGANTFSRVADNLPAYARPRFIRIQRSFETTGTFKMKKVALVEDGFDPAAVQDPLYFQDPAKKTYVPLTEEIYNSINAREIKL
uniref:Uncharacterized protein n=1 Tax=Hucho hucho TaxID=62062 RepID=A0A4W5LI65_9TELE